MVSVDVKRHLKKYSAPTSENIKPDTMTDSAYLRSQELCESGGERPGLSVPNSPCVSVDVKQHFKIENSYREPSEKIVSGRRRFDSARLSFLFNSCD